EARDKIKVMQDMLDRAGLNATNKLLVGVGEIDPVERLFRDLLADPDGLVDTRNTVVVQALPQSDGEDSVLLRGWQDDEVVDAEIVEDDTRTVPEWANDEA
ncbi:MAG: hypothetical protein ACSLEW_11215, partial [Nocardioides sp.]